MDKNTITGLILIFAIFIGFSLYNGNRMNKSYKEVIEVADSLYAKGDMENARAEYINALRFKPNQAEAFSKLNEINRLLGFAPAAEKDDSAAVPEKGTSRPREIHAVNADDSRK